MKRRDLLTALAILAVFGLGVILFDQIGFASAGGPGPDRYRSERYGFSVPVPAGWHRSRSRLVPELLDPREIVSLGNFAMRAGGGGNCGREPKAAISAMRPGDALVSLQEVAVHPRLRSHLPQHFPARPGRFSLDDLRGGAWLGDSKTAGPMRYTKLVFSARGRAFEALVYIDGAPTPALRSEVEAILDGLRFQPRR
jgi:hypothetical protein